MDGMVFFGEGGGFITQLFHPVNPGKSCYHVEYPVHPVKGVLRGQ
jgi:hypothetical protein